MRILYRSQVQFESASAFETLFLLHRAFLFDVTPKTKQSFGTGAKVPKQTLGTRTGRATSAEPEGPRKTPPESWPGWLRFRWSSLLDQDGVDLPGATSNLLGTDLIIRNCARARRLLINIIVLIRVALRFRAQIIRCHCGQIMLLQFFVTLPHFRRHLVEIFLRFDGTAAEQFPLRIFRRQSLLALFVFDPQLG